VFETSPTRAIPSSLYGLLILHRKAKRASLLSLTIYGQAFDGRGERDDACKVPWQLRQKFVGWRNLNARA
jgi:hypothetical protein